MMHSATDQAVGGKNQGKPTNWDRFQRLWYNFYLLMGVGVNFLIYFTKPYGFDPGQSVLWGSLVGIGIPMCTMFAGVAIHKRLIRV